MNKLKSIMDMPVIVHLTCPICKKQDDKEISQEQFNLYMNRKRNGIHVQDVFPDMPAPEREQFISGYCPTCWDELFGGGEQ